jgi:alpha-glucosidase (family GH31 glycosyl hydrolase)
VAPVVDLGRTARDVWLPPGRWVPFWDAVHYDPVSGAYTATGRAPVLPGGRTVHVDAPLGRTPLFVKAGTCLPLLPADVDTLADPPPGASTPGVVGLAQGIGRVRELPFAARCG